MKFIPLPKEVANYLDEIEKGEEIVFIHDNQPVGMLSKVNPANFNYKKPVVIRRKRGEKK
jgi:hypothetical protein